MSDDLLTKLLSSYKRSGSKKDDKQAYNSEMRALRGILEYFHAVPDKAQQDLFSAHRLTEEQMGLLCEASLGMFGRYLNMRFQSPKDAAKTIEILGTLMENIQQGLEHYPGLEKSLINSGDYQALCRDTARALVWRPDSGIAQHAKAHELLEKSNALTTDRYLRSDGFLNLSDAFMTQVQYEKKPEVIFSLVEQALALQERGIKVMEPENTGDLRSVAQEYKKSANTIADAVNQITDNKDIQLSLLRMSISQFSKTIVALKAFAPTERSEWQHNLDLAISHHSIANLLSALPDAKDRKSEKIIYDHYMQARKNYVACSRPADASLCAQKAMTHMYKEPRKPEPSNPVQEISHFIRSLRHAASARPYRQTSDVMQEALNLFSSPGLNLDAAKRIMGESSVDDMHLVSLMAGKLLMESNDLVHVNADSSNAIRAATSKMLQALYDGLQEHPDKKKRALDAGFYNDICNNLGVSISSAAQPGDGSREKALSYVEEAISGAKNNVQKAIYTISKGNLLQDSSYLEEDPAERAALFIKGAKYIEKGVDLRDPKTSGEALFCANMLIDSAQRITALVNDPYALGLNEKLSLLEIQGQQGQSAAVFLEPHIAEDAVIAMKGSAHFIVADARIQHAELLGNKWENTPAQNTVKQHLRLARTYLKASGNEADALLCAQKLQGQNPNIHLN